MKAAQQELEIVALARDLVSLWTNPKIKALARTERNQAIEETRQRMIDAVEAFDASLSP